MKKVKFADICVFDNIGRLLILQRISGDDFAPNTWCLPGGHKDPFEDFTTTAKRELQEETGLEVKKCEKVGEYRDSKSSIEYHSSNIDEVGPIVVLESSEHSNYKWIDLNEFLEDKELEGIMNLKDNLKKIYFPYVRNVEIIKKSIDKINSKYIEKLRKLKALRDPDNIEDWGIVQKSEAISGGLADNKTAKDLEKKYNIDLKTVKEKLLQGIKVELEHTDDRKVAAEITMDHLWEDKDYYAKLKKIEKAIQDGRLSPEIKEQLLEKARTGVYADTSQNRQLKRVGRKYGAVGKQDTSSSPNDSKQEETAKKQSPKGLGGHAKEASGSALEAAAKESPDSEVRVAAHKELDRRDKEEKVPEKEVESKQGQEKKDYTQSDLTEEKPKPKEDSENSEKQEESSRTTKEIEAEIKKLRDADIDYSDEKALDDNLKQVTDLLKERKRVLEEEKGLRKVGFEEHRKGFKKLETPPDPHKPDYAEDYYNKIKEGLSGTRSEYQALGFYSEEGYEDIREYLTNSSDFEKENTDKYSEAIKSSIEDISLFISKNKLSENLSINRRVKGSGIKFFKELKDGDVYEDKSFSSTSLAEQNIFGDFNIEILAKKGSSVANIDNNMELEYLIDKGSKFRVLKTSDKGIIVELL